MTAIKLTAAQAKDKIARASAVTLSKGIYTARKGFYWGASGAVARFEKVVRDAFPTATIIGSGEVDRPFKGGAPVSKQSHYWVKFTFSSEAES